MLFTLTQEAISWQERDEVRWFIAASPRVKRERGRASSSSASDQNRVFLLSLFAPSLANAINSHETHENMHQWSAFCLLAGINDAEDKKHFTTIVTCIQSFSHSFIFTAPRLPLHWNKGKENKCTAETAETTWVHLRKGEQDASLVIYVIMEMSF